MRDTSVLNQMINKRIIVEHHDELSEPMEGRIISWTFAQQNDGLYWLLYEVKIYDVENYNIICDPTEITVLA